MLLFYFQKGYCILIFPKTVRYNRFCDIFFNFSKTLVNISYTIYSPQCTVSSAVKEGWEFGILCTRDNLYELPPQHLYFQFYYNFAHFTNKRLVIGAFEKKSHNELCKTPGNYSSYDYFLNNSLKEVKI